MKIAIVHEWLATYAGSERVLEQMLEVFPDADLFSLVDHLPANDRGFIMNKEVKTSFINNLPFSKKRFRNYLPLMPLAIEQFDLSQYDIVISSSHAVAKGVLTGPNQLHICVCYSPIRYAWDLQHQYLKETGLTKGIKGWIVKVVLSYIRIWDYRTSNSVDEFIAISHFIKRRIWKIYRRESRVIYPPVDVSDFKLFNETKEEYYVTASRMVPYKKIDLIVDAFKDMPTKKLIVIGDGPDYQKIKSKAGPNITLVGYQGKNELIQHLQQAKAFIFAAEEDFGIAPLEAQACGTPVIAFGKGGALETIVGDRMESNPTGVFFNEQTTYSLIEAVTYFEANINKFRSEKCRENAMRFTEGDFRQELEQFVLSKWNEKKHEWRDFF